jgi:hypothetical protein
MSRIRISVSEITHTAKLNESNTDKLLWNALPVESEARRWGDEVYFEIPVQSSEEDAQPEVPAGTVAYWPPGKALCLFFGQQPYSPVNIVGQLDGDPTALAPVGDGVTVRVERLS